MGGPMDMIFCVHLRDLSEASKKYHFAVEYQKMFKTQWPLKKKWTVLRPPNYIELIELNMSFLELS